MYSISFLTTMVMTINIRAKTEIKMTMKDASTTWIRSKWQEFLNNGRNKLQLVNLLVDLIKDGAVEKDVYVNRGNDCYFR